MVSSTIFGCITTGEDWQFLKLEDDTLTIDSQRYYINDVGLLLAVLQTIIASYTPPIAVSAGV